MYYLYSLLFQEFVGSHVIVGMSKLISDRQSRASMLKMKHWLMISIFLEKLKDIFLLISFN